MKNAIISAMVLTIFVLVSAKVFAHGEGECLTDADGNVRFSNGGWVKIIEHLRDEDLDDFAHGHLYENYDKGDNSTGKGIGYFNVFDNDEGDYFADCPQVRTMEEAGHPNTPILRPLTPIPHQPSRGRSQRSPVNSCDPEPASSGFDCDSLRVGTSEKCHEWNFYQSRFAGIPVLPESIETVADLSNYFDELTKGRFSKIGLIVNGTRRFFPETSELGAVVITPHLGIWASYDWSIGIVGYRVSGETVTLTLPNDKTRISHMIGFPEIPANYKRLSDLLIDGVVSVRDSVLKNDKPSFSYIYNEHDEYDRLIEVGDAVMVRIRKDVTFDLSSEVASAPMARRHNTLATSWGGLKRMP